ncbi:hypothetical protein CASFOL_018923 [Castilleja foliolosa]|uniref:Uncharacterized protein n=1 Tax=Castilleja foliolosa TaxID=1961234 RepID=A0ABD3D5Z3_9LAMI
MGFSLELLHRHIKVNNPVSDWALPIKCSINPLSVSPDPISHASPVSSFSQLIETLISGCNWASNSNDKALQESRRTNIFGVDLVKGKALMVVRGGDGGSNFGKSNSGGTPAGLGCEKMKPILNGGD